MRRALAAGLGLWLGLTGVAAGEEIAWRAVGARPAADSRKPEPETPRSAPVSLGAPVARRAAAAEIDAKPAGQAPVVPVSYAAPAETRPPTLVVRAQGNDARPTEVLMMPSQSGMIMAGGTPVMVTGDYACCDDGGGCGGHFVAGVGFYYIQPTWESNPAFTTSLTTREGGLLNPTITTSTRISDFNYDFEFAPRVWIGYVTDSGLGVRLSWWHLDASASAALANDNPDGITTITSAAPLGLSIASPGLIQGPFAFEPDELTFSSNVEFDVFDLEATQTLNTGCWSILLSGGVRYARVDQSYNATRINNASLLGGIFEFDESDTLGYSRSFDGVGPTGAIEVRRAIGNTGLSLYGSGRGSLLFGHTKEKANLASAFKFSTLGFTIIDRTESVNASASRDDVIPVLELEIGAEYACEMGWGSLFVRAGLVGQTWFGAGNTSNQDGDLSLVGVTVVAGIVY